MSFICDLYSFKSLFEAFVQTMSWLVFGHLFPNQFLTVKKRPLDSTIFFPLDLLRNTLKKDKVYAHRKQRHNANMFCALCAMCKGFTQRLAKTNKKTRLCICVHVQFEIEFERHFSLCLNRSAVCFDFDADWGYVTV